MPIRPERKHLYPANWKTEIVPMLKHRSGDRCETCGVENGATIQRARNIGAYAYIAHEKWRMNLLWDENKLDTYAAPCNADTDLIAIGEWNKPIRIVLTAAHLNHDETDNRPENLAYWCQLHHNRHDAPHRAATRKATKNHQTTTDKNQISQVDPEIT